MSFRGIYRRQGPPASPRAYRSNFVPQVEAEKAFARLNVYLRSVACGSVQVRRGHPPVSRNTEAGPWLLLLEIRFSVSPRSSSILARTQCHVNCTERALVIVLACSCPMVPCSLIMSNY